MQILTQYVILNSIIFGFQFIYHRCFSFAFQQFSTCGRYKTIIHCRIIYLVCTQIRSERLMYINTQHATIVVCDAPINIFTYFKWVPSSIHLSTVRSYLFFDHCDRHTRLCYVITKYIIPKPSRLRRPFYYYLLIVSRVYTDMIL